MFAYGCKQAFQYSPAQQNFKQPCIRGTRFEIVLQSQENPLEAGKTKATPDEVDQIVSFHDTTPGTLSAMKVEPSFEGTFDPPEAQLENFVMRPVLISTLTWAQGSFTPVTLRPWALLMSNSAIKRKLDNYYLFRGNIKLKFVINASPFYYGCMLVSYTPLADYYNPAPINGDPAGIGRDNIPRSQRPHIYLYPQNNQGGEMILPFFWHREWLDISELDDVNAMGTIDIRTLADLRNANGLVGQSINIQVYAMLQNVELSGPSVKLILQSQEDEYGDGIVSAPASAIARAAGRLSDIPVIGRYATATSIGASAVSRIAKLFGFTNPPNISNVNFLTPHPFPHNATTEISVGMERLCTDTKNELTIDSSIAGADLGDELNITSIVTRESYLTTFTWTAANIPNDLLFSIGLTPRMVLSAAFSANMDYIYGTPMWMVSRMFAYWRGDIDIRFKIIASQYHRGRLRFSWDPNGDISSVADSTTEVYTKVVDIQTCSDITIRIPYMQDTAYCQTGTSLAACWANGTRSYIPFFENGCLTVRVLNDQSSPVASADIQVLVFVRGCENLEFAYPNDVNTDNRLNPFIVQSKEFAYDEEDSVETNISLRPSNAPKHINLVYFGEHVGSLRTILHRFSISTAYPINDVVTTNDLQIAQSKIARRPLYPGYDPNGVNRASSLPTPANTRRYNFVKYHPINWVSQCFVADRGSMNVRVNFVTPSPLSTLTVCRTNPLNTVDSALTINGYVASNTSTTGNQSLVRTAVSSRSTEQAGAALTNMNTTSGITANIPMYSIYKFFSTTPANRTLGITQDLSNLDSINLQAWFLPRSASVQSGSLAGSRFEVSYGAGIDYNPVFFLNVPTLYYYSSLPGASENPVT